MKQDILSQIEQAEDRSEERFLMKAWDVPLVLKEPHMGMIQKLRSKYLVLTRDGKMDMMKSDIEGFNYGLISAIVHTEADEKLFETGDEAKEILKKKGSKSVNELVEACARISGADTTEEEAEGN
jgi:hypothetical protein